ncbi:MAG: GNAT family N-acetyltransferase [Methylobacteriaceae bacterium]|nr:GNAT family N-acetyltransferase [Methylobacteriaceae bacterium]
MFEPSAVGSPYQRLAWTRAYAASELGRNEQVQVLLLRNAIGHPVLVLPVTVASRMGLRIASGVGGRHANHLLPLVAPDAPPLEADELRRLLVEAGRRLELDLYAFNHVPRHWDGRPVALSALGSPSADDAYAARLDLDPDPEATLRRILSRTAHRKLRKKRNALRQLGEVRYVVADSAELAAEILHSFFQQKAERFRMQGTRDPFTAAAADFINRAATEDLAEGHPALEVSGLLVDGRVVAAFGGAVHGGRFSAMINSFDPDFARYSPGDQIAWEVIAHCCRVNRRVFDFGAGDGLYKRRFCQEVEELTDVVLPVTTAGHLAKLAADGALAARRHVKRSKRLMGALRTVRRVRARMSG